MSMMLPYIVVVGKIKNITKHQRTQGIQRVLQRINEEYFTFISPLKLHNDNQIIGAFYSVNHFPKILLRLKNELFPLQVEFGIGICKAYESDLNDVLVLANHAVEEVCGLKRKKEKALCDSAIRIKDALPIYELATNSILKLMYVIEQNWTSKQRSIIHTMLFDGVTQANVASMYDVSASNVTQMLTNGNYFVYKESLENLETILKDVFDNIVKGHS